MAGDGAGGGRHGGISSAMWAAEDARRATLQRRTLRMSSPTSATPSTPRAAVKAAQWYQEVLS
ncbi:MAG: hypothetical protein H0U89_06700 [Acidimicrobiia bacterium]|nr:hypothetical protein [Acidimicrobiia bacterium]